MTTCIVPNRALAVLIGYAATDWNEPINYSEYERRLDTWDVQLIERDDEPIGAAYFKDGEVHVSVLPEWRGRWATKGILKTLFDHDRVFTKVAAGHDHMFGILERLGFTRTGGNTLVKEH